MSHPFYDHPIDPDHAEASADPTQPSGDAGAGAVRFDGIDDTLLLMRCKAAVQAERNLLTMIRREFPEVLTNESRAKFRDALAAVVDAAAMQVREQAALPPGLIAAAQAVVDRWDTPLWKDVPHTAEFINRLRAALTQGTSQAEQSARHAGLDEGRAQKAGTQEKTNG